MKNITYIFIGIFTILPIPCLASLPEKISKEMLFQSLCCLSLEGVDLVAENPTARMSSTCYSRGLIIKESDYQTNHLHASQACMHCGCFITGSAANAYCCGQTSPLCYFAIQAPLYPLGFKAQQHIGQIILHKLVIEAKERNHKKIQ